MVEQKTTEAIAQESRPGDPQRRKLLKVIGGGVGLIAIGGGAYLLGKGNGENETPNPTTPLEATPTTQPNLATTTPAPETTSAESTPTTTPEVTTSLPSESLTVPLESLPTSVDDPQVWANKMADMMELVYNDLNTDALEYIYKGGASGNIAKALGDDIVAVGLTVQSYPDERYTVESRIVPERTEMLSNIISVDETRTFFGDTGRRIVDYLIQPEDIYVDTGNGAELVTLYLINRVDLICEYDSNGVCR